MLKLGKNEGEIVFFLTSGFLFLAILLLLIFKKRLVPHPLYSTSNESSELTLYIRNTILFDEDDTDDVVLEDI